jgi:hypothetical protein
MCLGLRGSNYVSQGLLYLYISASLSVLPLLQYQHSTFIFTIFKLHFGPPQTYLVGNMHYTQLLAIVAAGAAFVAGAPVEKKSVENLDKRFVYWNWDASPVEKRAQDSTLGKRFVYWNWDDAPVEKRADEISALDKRFVYWNWDASPVEKRAEDSTLGKRFVYWNWDDAPVEKRADEISALDKRFVYWNWDDAPMGESTNTTPYHDKLSTEAFLYGRSRFADQRDI